MTFLCIPLLGALDCGGEEEPTYCYLWYFVKCCCYCDTVFMWLWLEKGSSCNVWPEVTTDQEMKRDERSWVGLIWRPWQSSALLRLLRQLSFEIIHQTGDKSRNKVERLNVCDFDEFSFQKIILTNLYCCIVTIIFASSLCLYISALIIRVMLHHLITPRHSSWPSPHQVTDASSESVSSSPHKATSSAESLILVPGVAAW